VTNIPYYAILLAVIHAERFRFPGVNVAFPHASIVVVAFKLKNFGAVDFVSVPLAVDVAFSRKRPPLLLFAVAIVADEVPSPKFITVETALFTRLKVAVRLTSQAPAGKLSAHISDITVVTRLALELTFCVPD
jgi:hypothetical protein